MSGTTFTWVGDGGDGSFAQATDWNVGTNWTPSGGAPPNSDTVVAVVDNTSTFVAVVSGGSIDTVGTLSVGGDGQVIVGGNGAGIGGTGGGTLIATEIDVTSTNSGGGLVGGIGAVISAPLINLGPGAILGGGGDFELGDTGAFVNQGLIQADGNNYSLGALKINGGTIDNSGGGAMEIDGSSTLDLGSAVNGGTLAVNTVDGVTAPATLILEHPDTFHAALYLSGSNMAFDLVLPGYTVTGGTWNNGTLSIVTTTGTIDIPFTSNGVTTFAGSGDELTMVVCFARGTRIRTPDGDVAIEELTPGQHVVTADGNVAAIKWIGHRKVNCQRHPDPRKVWPVRIQAGAFGRGLPARDLLVSPQHALFTDGVLIPARYLINGRNVVQQEVDSIEYFHIELGCHDILLAEGMPAESYLDTGDRRNFDNNKGPVTLHPDFGLWCWDSRACAELKVTGAEVDAVRARLLARARASRRSRRVAAA